MNRMFLTSLIALVACSESNPLEPAATMPEPAFFIQDVGNGGVALTTDTGCDHTDKPLRYVCKLDALNVPAGPANVKAWGMWTATYQCVNPVTGMPSTAPPEIGHPAREFTKTLQPSTTGEVAIKRITLNAPTESEASAQLCGNQGSFTAAKFLSPLTKYIWSLAIESANNPGAYNASRMEIY